MIQIFMESDWSEIDKELHRVEGHPNSRDDFEHGSSMREELDRVMYETFMEVEGDIHVRTGSLKSSAKEDTSVKGPIWTGELKVGGASEGVHNPVKYAVYEQARGGAHDFMAPTDILELKLLMTMLDNL